MAAAAGSAAGGAPAAYRVLAFEDTYSMAQILGDGGVAYAQLEQKWTTKCVRGALTGNARLLLPRVAGTRWL